MSGQERTPPGERIARLIEGQPAPAGFEIVRVLQETTQPAAPFNGANYERVYVVVVSPAGGVSGDKPPEP